MKNLKDCKGFEIKNYGEYFFKQRIEMTKSFPLNRQKTYNNYMSKLIKAQHLTFY